MPLTSLRSTPSELAIFYAELGKLLLTDLSLSECLEILQPGVENPGLQKQVAQLQVLAREGNTLAQGLDKTPGIANRIIVRLLESTASRAEASAVLLALADELVQTDSMREIKERVFFWPIVYLVIAMVSLSCLSVFVLPALAEFYESMRAPLPLVTQSLMLLSWQALLTGALLLGLVLALYRKPVLSVRRAIDGLLLRLPIWGGLSRKIGVNQYLRTLSSLLLRKIPFAEALVLAAESVDNQALAHSLLRHAAPQGRGLLETLRDNPLIPARFTTAMVVAEKTRTVDDVLRFSIASCGDAMINDMQRYQDSLELVLKIAIGILFGHIAIGMYLPIFKMGAAI
ncbi:type 4 pilus assembly protein PilG [soil metagenome]